MKADLMRISQIINLINPKTNYKKVKRKISDAERFLKISPHYTLEAEIDILRRGALYCEIVGEKGVKN